MQTTFPTSKRHCWGLTLRCKKARPEAEEEEEEEKEPKQQEGLKEVFRRNVADKQRETGTD
jgi:hypothetical protein